MSFTSVEHLAELVIDNIETVIVGKRETVEFALIALFSRGHVLIEDVPGVGKTMLALSLAHSIGCEFSRIQFTPDMLPSDVTGVSVFNQRTQEFEFRPGPLIDQIVLADEINRATPKTQAGLLEAMAERQITVDGVTYQQPEPFMVLATQNPIEYEGTFPLPEAQMDRFLMRLDLGYTSLEQEIEILDRQQYKHPVDELEQVVTANQVLRAQEDLKDVFVSPAVKTYLVKLVRRVRDHPAVQLGPSPRASLSLYRTGQARSAIRGRDFVLPDDVKALAHVVLGHRILLRPEVAGEGREREVLEEVLSQVPVPSTGKHTP